MSVCPGDPEGHQWVLQKQGREIAAAFFTSRSLFKKRIIVTNESYLMADTKITSIWNMWYCSKCRTFDKEETLIPENQPEELLKQGYAVRAEQGRDKLVYPEYTHKEWLLKYA